MDALQAQATEPLRLLAFVRPELHAGPVLYAEGAWSVLPRVDARDAPAKARAPSGIPKTFSTMNRDPAPPKFRKRR